MNLLPAGLKVCNIDCAYCQYGGTRGAPRLAKRSTGWPTPSRVEVAVAERLQLAAERNELLDRLTVAGHGEPTLHPAFEEVTERLCRVRDRVAPRIRLAVLSNSTTAAWPDVRRGLNRFDDRYMKLDAGDPITCAYLNGPGTSIRAIIDALCGLPRIVVQAMFVTDTANQVDNTREGAVFEWLAALERIRPMEVHIYTLDRAPALSSLHPVPTCRLREIAEQVHAAGIPTEVFPARACERSPQSP